jgi:hypothetical protein
MKEDLPTIAQADESVALADHELPDSTDRGRAATNGRP